MRDARRVGPLLTMFVGLGMIAASFAGRGGPTFTVGLVGTTTTTVAGTTTVAPTTTSVSLPCCPGVGTVPNPTTTVASATHSSAAPAGGKELPETGRPVLGLFVAGIGLVGLGGVLLFLTTVRPNRRRHQNG